MRQRPIPQGILLFLLIAAIMLVIGFGLLAAVGRVLAAMGDVRGALVLDYICLGCGILFVLDLILLVLAMAVCALVQSEDDPEPRP